VAKYVGEGWAVESSAGGCCCGENGFVVEGCASEGGAGECCRSGKDPVVEGVGRGDADTAVDVFETTDAGVAGTLDPSAASGERFDTGGAMKQNPGP
jgi:hypothetical protein